MTELTCNEDTCDMETMAAQYNTTLRKIMDDQAPEKTKTVKKKPAMPGYNDEIKCLKRDRRKSERQWLRHRGDPIKNGTCREEYRLVRNGYRSAIDEAKTEYYSGKVQECAGDQKKLFEIIKSLTKPLQQEQYPDSDSMKDLADAFGDFFIMKIQKIRTKLDSQDPEPITIPRMPVKEEDMFLSFQPLTEDDVRKLIKLSPNKQCSSNPIPTWLLKECLDSLLPVLTLLVNKSLQIGYFLEKWKNALVKPLLKKLGLELVSQVQFENGNANHKSLPKRLLSSPQHEENPKIPEPGSHVHDYTCIYYKPDWPLQQFDEWTTRESHQEAPAGAKHSCQTSFQSEEIWSHNSCTRHVSLASSQIPDWIQNTVDRLQRTSWQGTYLHPRNDHPIKKQKIFHKIQWRTCPEGSKIQAWYFRQACIRSIWASGMELFAKGNYAMKLKHSSET